MNRFAQFAVYLLASGLALTSLTAPATASPQALSSEVGIVNTAVTQDYQYRLAHEHPLSWQGRVDYGRINFISMYLSALTHSIKTSHGWSIPDDSEAIQYVCNFVYQNEPHIEAGNYAGYSKECANMRKAALQEF